jgi:hypothetical protein
MQALAFTHEVRGVSSSSLHEGLILALRGCGLRLDASQPGYAQLSEPVGGPNSHCRLSVSLSFLNSHDGVLVLCLVRVLDAGTLSDQGSGYYLAARLQDIRKVIENRLRGFGAGIRSRSGDPGRARRSRGDVIARSREGLNGHHLRGTNGLTAEEKCRVIIDAPDGRHSLPRHDVEASFALGRFISGHPPGEAAEPQGLVGCVRALWWTIEAEIDASEVSLDDVSARMMRLLDRQVRIREQMPVRLVYRCRDCRLEKVIDPECVRLLLRNRQIMSAAGPGQYASAPEFSVFRPGGRLLSIKDLDPDYVCSRCQGTEADEVLATICPECGALSTDPVLSACTSTGCLTDFRRFLAHSRSALIANPLRNVAARM